MLKFNILLLLLIIEKLFILDILLSPSYFFVLIFLFNLNKLYLFLFKYFEEIMNKLFINILSISLFLQYPKKNVVIECIKKYIPATVEPIL